MPFTPSHVAAVVPMFRVRWLDPWALALGAMVLDLPIFLPFLPDYMLWHSAAWVVTINPLVVCVLIAAFAGIFRLPLVALLPAGLVGRAASLRPSPRIVPLLAGAMAGSATHVFWDSFTHSYSSQVWGWTWLDHEVLGVIPVFRLLQYLSSVAGLAFVAWWAWRGLSRMADVAAPEELLLRDQVRRAVLWASVAGAAAGAACWPLLNPPGPSLAALVTRLGAGTVVGLCVVLTVYAAIWQFRRLRRLMAGFDGA
ncbi:DUF4184 family protein [Nonomuraea sp. NPDC049152]|uniref:DUF4184 family protein n=1 Tax=Nonomuraea sp. NPDC049152 TaxID=3154350 RepID=UPI0034040205